LECVWEEDKANGKAKIMYGNGDVFEGQIIDNKKKGKGVTRF
jgi:hypothetical protein